MLSIPHASGIYQILCVPTGKIYIGSSEDLAIRLRTHVAALRSQRHENSYLQRAWNKYGESAFEFSVIELVLVGFCLEREQYWLDKKRSYEERRGFNISRVAGAPMAGRKHTPETLAKMKASRLASGYKHSAETRQKMSDQNRGKIFGVQTEESRRKRAESGRGRKHSPETIEKMRQARLANNPAIRQWIVTDPDGTELHITNLRQFCAAHGLSADCMQHVMRTGGQHRGWRCRHAD